MRATLFILVFSFSIPSWAMPKIAGYYKCSEAGSGVTSDAQVKLQKKKLFITGLDVDPLNLADGLECVNSPKQQSLDINQDQELVSRTETSASCSSKKILLTLVQDGPGEDTAFQTSLTIEKANVLYIGISATGYVQGQQVNIQKDYLCEKTTKPQP